MLLFMDSFDHYLTADAQGKFWILTGAMGIGSLGGRHTTNSIHAGASGDTAIRPIGSTSPTVIVGVAVKSPLGGGPNNLLSIWDGGTAVNQVFLQLNPSDGTISAWRGAATSVGVGNVTGATLLGTSAPALVSNVYAYLECRVVLSDTVGQVEVRVNGTQVLLLTGIDTIASTGSPSPYWTSIALGTSGASTVTPVPVDWDDLYVCDGSGAAPWNAFLGDCRVDSRIPTGPGSSTQWTGTPGLNWLNVKDTTPNADTDYNTGLAAQTDLFDMQDVVAPGVAIFGLQHNLSYKKLDNGLCTITPMIRHAGNNYAGAGLTPTTNYTYGVQVAATNPATGVAWTETDFNAAQFGYRRTV